jgi:hypothetical protein
MVWLVFSRWAEMARAISTSAVAACPHAALRLALLLLLPELLLLLRVGIRAALGDVAATMFEHYRNHLLLLCTSAMMYCYRFTFKELHLKIM